MKTAKDPSDTGNRARSRRFGARVPQPKGSTQVRSEASGGRRPGRPGLTSASGDVRETPATEMLEDRGRADAELLEQVTVLLGVHLIRELLPCLVELARVAVLLDEVEHALLVEHRYLPSRFPGTREPPALVPAEVMLPLLVRLKRGPCLRARTCRGRAVARG